MTVEADIVVLEASGEQFEAVMDSLAASQLASQATIVAFPDHSEPRWFAEALRGGVRDEQPSDMPPDQLVAALGAAGAELIVLHPAEVDALFPAEPASRPLEEFTEPLSPRDGEVLQMLASGLANWML